MAIPRAADIVLQPSVSKTATFISAGIDDLDKVLRGTVQVIVTACDATSTWQIALQASADGTNWFEIMRSASALIAGATITVPAHYTFGIHSVGDGIEPTGTTTSQTFTSQPIKSFDAAAVVALAASTHRPGMPWRALRFVITQTAAGGGLGLTYSATLYAVNEQSASQGMG